MANGHGMSFPKSDKNWILSSALKHADLTNIQQSSAKNVTFTLKISNRKTGRLSFFFAMECKTWRWYCHFSHDMSFPKVTKETVFCHQRPKSQFAGIWQVDCVKIVNFILKVSIQKLIGYSSSLLWYAKLGVGITGLVVVRHSPKVTKNYWTV